MPEREDILRDEIISVGSRIYERHLSVAKSGNLSARIDGDSILITATGTFLGGLQAGDIIRVDLTKDKSAYAGKLSTEFPMHSLIYKSFPEAKTIIHCHPPLSNGYFSVYSDLKILTFESRLYLGEVPVIAQDTPSITKLEPVIDALKMSNLVAIKNHGVVAVTGNFADGFDLVESLEDAVKVAGVARLFKKDMLDGLDKGLEGTFGAGNKAFDMFSRGHIQEIVDLVNKDEFILAKGNELDMTLKLAIKLDGSGAVYKFNFDKGKIVKLEFDEDASFVISAPNDIWVAIFLGKLDPFVATTQGKMKLKGDLGKLSRWYVPFSRLFQIFKEVKIK
ncbi:MAG: class II aldolase/adducin family protein [Candidatus Omnitrophota bacterium]|jgi:L-fuculose-phosphate aldolase